MLTMESVSEYSLVLCNEKPGEYLDAVVANGTSLPEPTFEKTRFKLYMAVAVHRSDKFHKKVTSHLIATLRGYFMLQHLCNK